MHQNVGMVIYASFIVYGLEIRMHVQDVVTGNCMVVIATYDANLYT